MGATSFESMKRRKVVGITGIRSEYFLQRPIFQAITEHPELELGVVVTGAHLSPLHGFTVNEVEADGFPILAKIDSLILSDHDADRIKGAAVQLRALTEVIDELRPDWLLAPADREEAITLALAGSYMGLPIAHYGAGDRVVGNVDDMVRHAVSRLAHLLLTTHEDARNRLIKAGEEEWRVHNVGHAGLDRMRLAPHLTLSELSTQLNVPPITTPFLVVIQHPLSSEMDEAASQMQTTLDAVIESGLQVFISYPNSDPGSKQIIEVIEQLKSEHPQINVFRNIPDVPFVNLLRHAEVLVGNSSLGLLEAPFLNLPVINVGRRQTTRHHTANVTFVPHEKNEIVATIRKTVQERRSQFDNPFGDGHTGERVANLLATIPLDKRLLNKDLSY
jgi:GDP/UDP-N,N'-diacetylbacillosamine 2-epimerase (hydrolysing)